MDSGDAGRRWRPVPTPREVSDFTPAWAPASVGDRRPAPRAPRPGPAALCRWDHRAAGPVPQNRTAAAGSGLTRRPVGPDRWAPPRPPQCPEPRSREQTRFLSRRCCSEQGPTRHVDCSVTDEAGFVLLYHSDFFIIMEISLKCSKIV